MLTTDTFRKRARTVGRSAKGAHTGGWDAASATAYAGHAGFSSADRHGEDLDEALSLWRITLDPAVWPLGNGDLLVAVTAGDTYQVDTAIQRPGAAGNIPHVLVTARRVDANLADGTVVP